MTVCEGFFSPPRTALLILFPWVSVWQADCWPCLTCPPSLSVPPCLPDLTRSILVFLSPSQGTLNQMPFQLAARFPPVAMWWIRRGFLQYISQIYVGITKQKLSLPSSKMLCHSLSISVRDFIFAIMLLALHRAETREQKMKPTQLHGSMLPELQETTGSAVTQWGLKETSSGWQLR